MSATSDHPAAEPADALFMVRLPIDQHSLVRFGQRFGLFRTGAPDDEGYLVHALFAALFGAAAPKPFAVPAPGTRRGQVVSVLAYAGCDHNGLEQEAAAFADPAAYGAVLWSDAAAKPMPVFPSGARLGFEVRACPIRRLARGAPNRADRARATRHTAGAEVDAFQAQWLEREPPEVPLSRGAMYVAWLGERFAPVEGARLIGARLTAFRRTRLVRRGHEEPNQRRPLVGIERPDATFRGLIEVTEPQSFRRLLTRGVGRHRAFGFGMLLLRRAEEMAR